MCEVPTDDSGVFPPRGEYLEISKDLEASLEAEQEFFQQIMEAAGIAVGSEPVITPGTFDIAVMTTRTIGAVYPYVFGKQEPVEMAAQSTCIFFRPCLYRS